MSQLRQILYLTFVVLIATVQCRSTVETNNPTIADGSSKEIPSVHLSSDLNQALSPLPNTLLEDGRGAGARLFNGKDLNEISRGIRQKNQCVERVTCELSKMARGSGFSPKWLQKMVEKSTPQFGFMERISRASKSPRCSEYHCDAARAMKLDSVSRGIKSMMKRGGGGSKSKKSAKLFSKSKH